MSKIFTWAFVLLTSLSVLISCSDSDDDNTPVSINDGSMTYDLNGESVQALGFANVNCTYSESQKHFWVYGITGLTANPVTNVPEYDHRLDFVVSNVESLEDLVGQTIPFYSDTTSAGDDLFFTSIYSTKEALITVPISATITITSVANNKLVGTFNADFGNFGDNTTVTHSATNGAFNSINIIVY